MSTLTVVIPCYNEEAVLPMLFERLSAAAQNWGVEWNVICVDDGSRDRSWEMLVAQTRRDSRWQAVRLSRNFGQQLALSAGLSEAKGDAVVMLDADLQDDPAMVRQFVEKWREGYQVVYAVRASRREGFFKKLAYKLYYKTVTAMVDFPLPMDAGDFGLMDRKVVDLLRSMPERARSLRNMRAWVGFRQVGLPQQRAARAAGVPKYTFSKLVKLATSGIFPFSTVPLKVASVMGFWISGLAFAGILFTLAQKIFFRDYFASIGWGVVPGYATIVMSVLFMGGVQLICLGIIGEYIGRIYEEVKQRPAWIVSERTAAVKAGEPANVA